MLNGNYIFPVVSMLNFLPGKNIAPKSQSYGMHLQTPDKRNAAGFSTAECLHHAACVSTSPLLLSSDIHWRSKVIGATFLVPPALVNHLTKTVSPSHKLPEEARESKSQDYGRRAGRCGSLGLARKWT